RIDGGGVTGAVGTRSEAPAVSPDSLRGHDAVVRRVALMADALLPARFGTLAPDARGLCERLERAAADLHEALARVAGREQMILRVFTDGPGPAPPPEMDPSDAGGPGTRYLAERARAQRAATA